MRSTVSWAADMSQRKSSRGVAFVVVIWFMVLLAVLLSGFVVVARTEAVQARFLFDSAQARYAAEAGVSRASWELRNTDPLTMWVPDGRQYEFDFEGAKVTVEVQDESGKIDINAASLNTLTLMFKAVGVEQVEADKLAAAVVDWRDVDDLVTINGAEDDDYESADLSYGAADAPFTTIGELQQVLGMNYELYAKLQNEITIYGGMDRPNPAFASQLGLQTIEGIDPLLAQQLLEMRRQFRPGDPAAAGAIMPDGSPLLAQGGTGTYTLRSKATMPNKTWTLVDATIRLGGAPGARAYSILRWREGSAD
jgi:general secretion pathway protein K